MQSDGIGVQTRAETTRESQMEDDTAPAGVISRPAPLKIAHTKGPSEAETTGATTKMNVEQLSFYYGRTRALQDITLAIPSNRVTALIGPSGCGKSTLIRTLNRMNDIIPGVRIDGRIELDGEDIYAAGTDVVLLRRRVGMVFQKPNPFPRSIFDNVAYGLRINQLTRSKSELADRVEASLRGAALWDEVKDRLKSSAVDLSGGQQQRVCIARAGCRTGGRVDGRTYLGARSARHAKDRRADRRVEIEVHHCNRYPQYAAG